MGSLSQNHLQLITDPSILRQKMTKRFRNLALSICIYLLIALGQANTFLSGQETGVYLASSKVTTSNPLQDNRWPFEVNDGQFQIRSTVPISKLEPLLPKLNSLPTELNQALTISVVRTPIHVVVLESRDALEAYAKWGGK